MSLKAVKTWFLRLLPFVLCFICYYCSQFYFESYGVKSPQPTASLCHSFNSQRKWESLTLNISRKQDLFLKLEDFFWKYHPSPEALPYGVKGSELLLLKILAVTSKYTMPSNIERSDCRTCAVIGNGFAIKNSSLGEIINKYDVVIRLNNAPVRGYEEDVGNKTTLRMFYPESASYNPELNDDPDTLQDQKGFWKPPPLIWLGRPAQIRVLDPYFLRITARKLLRIPLKPTKQEKIVHPTTGILAVFVALNYCNVVHVAGFGYPESRNYQQPIHYYGQETMKSMKNSYHDLNQEAQVLKTLEEQGVIFYLHPHS
ncbi:hypothetical protein DNTS_003574 [Danionella cerebrum]|nr:hypothetical protein DNTS_003574 [Danionella translucida]